ncbi:tetraspanin-18-like isoform X3 [Gigantopelta aegis]|uniref:tetraspanin-18-like isoform X3 n=1 Tax=Gigantopelta aegis TaxID=1735272 RepID=UPI001B88D25C|nr:tetraspanin-18-like isoform X3 [Gigantopelta aegis]
MAWGKHKDRNALIEETDQQRKEKPEKTKSEKRQTLKKIFKYIFSICSLLLVLVGAVLVGLGLWPLLDKEYMAILSEAGLDASASIILVVTAGGGILFIVGFLGCCGAVMEKTTMLCFYINIVLFILMGQILAVILLMRMKEEIATALNINLVKTLKKEYDRKTDIDNVFSAALDWVQVTFYCCGINNYTEFKTASNWKDKNTKVVPETCCVITNRDEFSSDYVAHTKDPACTSKPTASNSYISTIVGIIFASFLICTIVSK